jgi:general secretion pathway protein L
MKSIGIDIGSSSIKVVEMLATSKGFQVVQCFERPLTMNPNQDQEIEIIEILREISSRYNPADTRFALALRQDQVSIRHKVFPFADRIKIHKSLAYELEEEIPFSSDNSIFDAKIVRTIGANAEILACAAPKHHIRDLLQRCSDSSIDPALISVEGMTFANIYERWNEPPPALPNDPMMMDQDFKVERNLNLVLNMGHTRTLICAFEGSSLIAIRTLLWGAKNIAEAVSRKYEIPFLDALQELQAKSFILTSKQGATFDQVTFSETIAKSVREMVRDMQLSILDLKSEFNAHITQIGITGGASNIKNLGPYLTQQLEVPVNKVYPLDLIPNVLFEKNSRTDSIFGMALGLAIDGLKKPRNPAVNFLRGDFAKQNNSFKALWQTWGPTARIIASAFVVFFLYSYLRESFSIALVDQAEETLKTQAKNVAKLPARKASEENVKKFIRENKKRAADLKTLASVASMNSAMDILKRVNDATPAKNQVTLDVKRIDIQDARVTVEGYVNTPVEMGRLQSSLGSLSLDGKVNAGSPALPKQSGKVAFSFNFKVDRGIAKTIQ